MDKVISEEAARVGVDLDEHLARCNERIAAHGKANEAVRT
jgi:hypothetical protein